MTIPLWRTIQKENFTRLQPLVEFLELTQEARRQLIKTPSFRLNLPRRLAQKIEKNSLNDPIFRQFVPLQEETFGVPGFVPDPLQDVRFRQTTQLLKKYRGRALLLPTGACAMHCRFCFRQHFPYETKEKNFDSEMTLLAQDPTITEVILSGGDPLSLSDPALSALLGSLQAIPHVQRIRFHTRFPIGIPERIDKPFLEILSRSPKQIFFVIHCNHPKEIDGDVAASLKSIQSLGIPVLNQSVLLKGVNDSEKTLITLSEVLTGIGVVPYYLHQMDPVQGGAHFAVPDERALALVDFLKDHFSGYGVPRLVREEPGYPSKTFITHSV